MVPLYTNISGQVAFAPSQVSEHHTIEIANRLSFDTRTIAWRRAGSTTTNMNLGWERVKTSAEYSIRSALSTIDELDCLFIVIIHKKSSFLEETSRGIPILLSKARARRLDLQERIRDGMSLWMGWRNHLESLLASGRCTDTAGSRSARLHRLGRNPKGRARKHRKNRHALLAENSHHLDCRNPISRFCPDRYLPV